MAAPVTSDDTAASLGQANPDGPTQASVYNGPSDLPGISFRALVTLDSGETPVIGARRIDHDDAEDYGFGADGIEYSVLTAAGLLIPDVAGLTQIDVLASAIAADDPIDANSLEVSTPPTHGAAGATQGRIWYAPVADYDGTDELEYTVDDDGADTSAPATVTLTIAEPAGAAMAATSFVVSPGTTVEIDPTAAFDQNADALPVVQAVEIVTAPVHGTAEVVGRKVSYTAESDFIGLDPIEWRTLINGIWTEAAVATLVVGKKFRKAVRTTWPRSLVNFAVPTEEPPPPPPPPDIEANDDEAITDFETEVTINLLINDIGTGLSIASVQEPTHGSAFNEGNGTITYTPDADFFGEDVFAYIITDGTRTAGATVRVTVNESPTAVFSNGYEKMAQVYALAQSAAMTAFPLLVDYTDSSLRTQENGGVVRSGGGLDIRLEDGAGNKLKHKRIVYDENVGRILAVVQRNLATSNRLIELYAGKPGEVVDEEDPTALAGHLAYWRMDTGEDLTGNERDLNFLSVTPPPVANPDSATTVQNTAVAINVLANDTGAGLSVSAVSNPPHGTAVNSGGGVVTYTPDTGYSGSDSFTYSLSGTGGVAIGTVTVTITATVALPVAVADTGTAAKNVPVTINVVANDTLNGASVSAVSNPPNGTAVNNGNGTVTYTPDTDYTGADSFTYTLTNATGSDSAAVSMTVTATTSDFVQVYAMAIDSADPGDIIRPGFNANGGNTYTPLAGKVYDFRGRVGTEHINSTSASTFRFQSGAATAVVCGGKVHSTNIRYSGTTAGAPWGSYGGRYDGVHGDTTYGDDASGNYASIRVYNNAPGFKLQGFYIKNSMDGVVPQPDKPRARDWIFENCCFREIRDDCVQDDGQMSGTWRNCYFQGHVFYSWRPGDNDGVPTPKSGEIVTFENCLIDVDRQMWIGECNRSGDCAAGHVGSKRAGKYISPTQRNNTIITGTNPGMGHQHPFKTHQTGDAGGLKIRVIMRNCLMRITTPPIDGFDPVIFPKLGDGVGVGSTTGSLYDNFHVCWVGPPTNGTGYGAWPWPQTKAHLTALGITLHDDETEAHDLWESTKAAWFAANGYDAATDTFSWNRP